MAFPILIGGGGISYITREIDFSHNLIQDSKAFLIIEPAAEIELNLTKHFRLSMGASYRFTTPFDVGMSGASDISSTSLKGISYMISLKFGKF